MKELFAIAESMIDRAEANMPRAIPFTPDARCYAAFSLGAPTEMLGALTATTLEHAAAEATERWSWDRGGRLGIREIGHEESKSYPFDTIPLDRLHIYAVRRSAPLRWELNRRGTGTRPIYSYKLELICAVDLPILNPSNPQGRR